MDPDPSSGNRDWSRIEALFHGALAKPPEQRAAYLDAACHGNEQIRREAAALLEALDRDGSLLEVRGLDVAARLLAHSQAAPSTPVLRVREAAPATRRAPPLWLSLLALVFLADCLLRAYCYVLGPDQFGYGTRLKGGRVVVVTVRPGSAAERTGIRPGDAITAIDGHDVRDATDLQVIGWNLEVGQTYTHEIRRATERLRLGLVVPRVRIFASWDFGVHAVWQLDALFLLATALLIAFARPADRLARLGALALATFAVGLYFSNMPPGYAAIWRNMPAAAGALLWIPNICIFLFGPIGLTFFLLFPRPLFRARWPWLLVWLPMLLLVPSNVVYTFLVVFRPAQAFGTGALPEWIYELQGTLYAVYGVADLGALAANYFSLADVNEKRRLRLLLAGGAAGALPGLLRWPLLFLAPHSAVVRGLAAPGPDVFVAAVFLLFPTCFAYAILRHRLFDIRVIVRIGLQYMVARGLLILLVPALAVGLFVDMLTHGDQPLVAVLRDRGWAYAAVALAAAAAHLRRKQWGEAVERHFFRERYDARRVLGEVVEDVRAARSFSRAVPGVVTRITAALHPEFAAILVRSPGSPTSRIVAAAPADRPLDLERLDLVVAIATSADAEEALLVLGPKRSEEPYSREDRQLLDAVAAGLALLFEQEILVSLVTPAGFEECPDCGSCADSGSGSCAVDGAALEPVPLPRTLAGRYRLERRRGRGGMGTVYEASDTTLARKVAVKVIREEFVTSASARRRFAREARVAAAFDHPNVVTVHDYGIEAGTRAFLVMELLEGMTLREALRRSGTLGPIRALEILRPVCNTVSAAHARQLIHRDLKPENIFLCSTGLANAGPVKILDFGVAKFLAGDEDAGSEQGQTETGIGVLVGTPGYMPPEQVLGERPAIGWDLWALAVVTYEILTGGLPFPVADRQGWMRSLLAGAYVPLDQHLPSPPARWQEFFARTLAVEPSARPASAGEFQQRLEEALA